MKKTKNFINITHLELINQIRNNLSDYYIDSDDRHLLFLKEYILNISSYYLNIKNDNRMEEIIKDFWSRKDQIKKFKEMDMNLFDDMIGSDNEGIHKK